MVWRKAEICLCCSSIPTPAWPALSSSLHAGVDESTSVSHIPGDVLLIVDSLEDILYHPGENSWHGSWSLASKPRHISCQHQWKSGWTKPVLLCDLAQQCSATALIHVQMWVRVDVKTWQVFWRLFWFCCGSINSAEAFNMSMFS